MNLLVAKKLKKLRIQKGFSQEKVADYLQISQSAYNRIEHGTCHSWVNYINAICNLYNIKPEDLLKREEVTDPLNSNVAKENFCTSCDIKLIEQYELRLKEKDAYIVLLEKMISNYK
ncbi:helix-turn-helix domain-containing protein [Polaribacter cellanae]|uniref:Helix-turn-helix transcriptional regulator n=1 Tax=Polaribacter cellanae TaxID=2818493 RepID=A0A975H6H1_9FLAO|nr:helix-turn-helix transcriptional regulator [Polaribacter cellanae]QTE22427.1 helix-turn-helix transcriptional regulator [Polaribacter cellanae]